MWPNQCLQSTKRLQKLSSEHTQKECRQMEEVFRSVRRHPLKVTEPLETTGDHGLCHAFYIFCDVS